MNHIIVRNLVKTFNEGANLVYAVNGVDLEVPQGQLLSIMGPSGSGKTTLLHILAGLSKPTSGQVLINDVDLATLNDHALTLFRRKNIGVVFQAYNLIPTLTAEENIMLPVMAGFKDIAKDRLEQALHTLLDRLQLEKRRRHYPDMMSGGEQQRVAIARALLMDFATETKGTLLLADEPTGNLDSENSQLICKLLSDLCRERNHTMVIVTHEQDVAKWTDRTIILKDGKITRQ